MKITDEQMQTLRVSFKKYDKNNDNTIDASELIEVLKDNGIHNPETIVDEVMKAIDKNHDGSISFIEFTKALQNISGVKEVEVDDIVSKITEQLESEHKIPVQAEPVVSSLPAEYLEAATKAAELKPEPREEPATHATPEKREVAHAAESTREPVTEPATHAAPEKPEYHAVKEEVKAEVKEEVKVEVKEEVKEKVKEGVKEEVKAEVKEEVKAEVKEEVKAEVKEEVKVEVKEEVKVEIKEQKVKIKEVKEKVKVEVKEEVKPEAKPAPAVHFAEEPKKEKKEKGEHKHEHKHGDKDHKHKHEEGSDDDDIPDLETPQAQQAGGSQGGQSEKKQSRSEKKMRKALSKMGLKPVPGIVRVTIKKGKNVMFVVSRPDVFKSPGTDTYIIVGEAKIEDQKAHVPGDALDQFNTPDAKVHPEHEHKEEEIIREPEPEEPVDETGLEQKDIDLVLSQTKATRAQAVKALRLHGGDIVNAIMTLTGV